MVRAKTLAVVIGLSAGTMTLAMAGPDRFIKHAVVVLGFDDVESNLSAQELMRQGTQQFRLGQYDEATRSFEQAAKTPGLSEREQEMLARHRALMVRVNKSRQEAADMLNAARKAHEQGDTKQAESYATSAFSNPHASDEVKAEAKKLLALAQGTSGDASAKSGSDDARRQAQQLVASARRHLREGNLDEAASVAERAESLGVSFSRWDDSPAKVLKDVADARSEKTKPARSAGSVEVPSSKSNAGNSASAKERAKILLGKAEAAYRRNDLDKAEELAREAKELNATFYFFETGPDQVLAMVEKARRQSTSKSRSIAAKPSTPAAPAKQSQIDSEDLTVTAHESPAGKAASAPHVADDAITIAPEPPTSASSASSDGPMLSQAETSESAPANAQEPLAAHVPAEVASMIVQARKLIDTGHFDEAEQLIAKVESHGIDWSRHGDQPDRLRRELAAARSQAPSETSDSRLQALALLRRGRAYLEAGKLDEAQSCADRAQTLKAEYRLLDDTPRQLLSDVAKARSSASSVGAASGEHSHAAVAAESGTSTPSWPADVAAIPTQRPAGSAKDVSRQAQGLLKKARDYMNRGEHDTAIEIARRVNGWGLEYSLLWDDTPAKVENAAKAMKARAVARSSRGGSQRDKAVAESLLADARKDLKAGRLDDAEQKARQAQQFQVTYGFGDRPESVLAAVEKARRSGRTNKVTPMPMPGDAASNIAQGKSTSTGAAEAVQASHSEVAAGSHSGPVFVPPQNVGRHEPHVASVPATLTNEPMRIMVPGDETPGVDNPPSEVVELLSEVKSRPLSAPAPRRTPSLAPYRAPGSPPASIAQTGAASPVGISSDSGVRVADDSGDAVPGHSDPHDQKLEAARTAFAHGNYPRAKQLASEVYSDSRAHQPQAEELISRIGVAEQTTVYQLYQAGVDSAKKGEYERALGFFQQVEAAHVELDPATEQQLRSYLRDLPGRIAAASGTRTAGRATIAGGMIQAQATDDQGYKTGNDLGQRERLRYEQLVTETSLKLQSARQLLPTDPNKAIQDLELAREQVRTSGLDESFTARLSARIDAAIRVASQEKQRIESENHQKLATEAMAAQRKRDLQVEAARQKQLGTLVEQANAEMRAGHFAEAEEIGRKAMELDPESPEAIAVHWKARVQNQLQIQKELRARKEDAVLRTLDSVDDSAIPWGNDNQYVVKYMDARNWDDLVNRRKKQVDGIRESTKSPLELEIERKMSQPITVNFTETPLADVVSFLQDATNVNVVLDYPALAADGIRSDKPVSMKLTNVRLQAALRLILGQLDLDYTIENDSLFITTPLKRQGKLLAQSYPVADLIMTPRGVNHNVVLNRGTIQPLPMGVTPANPATGMPSAALGQIGVGLGGTEPLADTTLGGSMSPSGKFLGRNESAGQQIDFQALIDLIQATISPNTWDTTGGPGTIEFFAGNNSLVINQTQAVHDQIADLLAQLRRLQDLQVAIEVRFITLNDDFFERIGIDFDIDVQSNAQKPLRSFGSVAVPGDPTATPATPPILNLFYNDHDDDVAVGVNSARDLTAPPTFTPNLKIPLRTGYFGRGRPQGFDPSAAFNFGIAFLSDIEVYLFLEAAQQNNRGNVLTAPKVTTFNGVNATVTAAEFRPFVIALIPVVSNGAVAFQPIPTVIPNGTLLSVTPVVSADRRYVRLQLAPQFFSITGERRFPISGAAGGFGGFGGGGGGAATTANAELVLPIFSLNAVATTVSVPDGGTVLMGGLKTKSEFRNEYSMPILNKVPYVNRLFTDTGVQSFTTSLLLMVTPRIIIQEEEEELLGKTYAF